MGTAATPDQPDPLPRHLLTEGIQKRLQTTRIHLRQQEETLEIARFDRGIEPAPLIAIPHDPGRTRNGHQRRWNQTLSPKQPSSIVQTRSRFRSRTNAPKSAFIGFLPGAVRLLMPPGLHPRPSSAQAVPDPIEAVGDGPLLLQVVLGIAEGGDQPRPAPRPSPPSILYATQNQVPN